MSTPNARRPPTLKRRLRSLALDALGVVRRIPRSQGILLTFDDGPHPDVTTAVLDLLARYDVRAVFFVVGHRVASAPHLLQRMLADGHVIGNHTQLHPLYEIPAFRAYYRDVAECQTVVEAHTGFRPRLFRPPLGSITISSLVVPRMLGLSTMLWSLDVNDWKLRREEDARVTGQRLAESAAVGDIILLHDDNPCVVPLLETALPRLCEVQSAGCRAAAIA